MPRDNQDFPAQIHHLEYYISTLPPGKLQQKLIQALLEGNRKISSIEEIGHPTVPNCYVIFMWGIADNGRFCYLNQDEAKKVQETISYTPLDMIDLYCAIRYYKNANGKKTPLKFDYYILRVGFGEHSMVEFQVHHERGPRYTSPEDLLNYVISKVNGNSKRKILKSAELEEGA